MLFLSDLDGTLMDSNGNVTDEDVECIHQWTQKHAFGFVTGRDRAFCVALASKYQLSCEYMITDNGANAYYKDKNVYSSLIDLSEGIQMCKAILAYNLDLFYTDEAGNRYYPISCYGKERLHVFKKKQPSLGLFSDGAPLYFDPYVPFVSLKTLSPVFTRDVARRSLSFSKNSSSSIGKVTGCPSHEDR